jgi:hypothetical protein
MEGITVFVGEFGEVLLAAEKVITVNFISYVNSLRTENA